MPPRSRRFLNLTSTVIRLTGVLAASAMVSAPSAAANDEHAAYAGGEVVVGYAGDASEQARAHTASAAAAQKPAPHIRRLRLRPGVSVPAAIAMLRRQHGVLWAVPDYRAHISTFSPPNDTGNPGEAEGDWQQLQWNFVGPFGVEALQAWSNVAADGAPGGDGVVIAVLDTGVAYATRGHFLRSPDFAPHTFVKGYDFVSHSPYPYDRNGHGTFVAGTIAEATNNRYGLTGLAYNARIMPVRVLNDAGEGDASVIAEGIRYAVNHGARVINLSIEFTAGVTAANIPELIDALRYAYHRGVLVVAAAGNQHSTSIPYPARAANVIAVGATTEHGCLASYSNYGRRITLVAPGGGADAELLEDPNCHPSQPPGRDIYQLTLTGTSPRRFGLPTNYEGTSMAAPHVAATAALIIAGHVLGPRPTPAALTARLKATARPLGTASDSYLYGHGLLDAAAATAPGGPRAARR